MDSNYIITPSGTFINADELYHSGIKGMKWGVRRYQNPDGSLTPAGRKRYLNSDGTLNKKGQKKFGNSVKTDESSESGSKSSGESTSSKTGTRGMTDAELQTVVNRLRNEDAYRDLSKKLGYDSPKTELDTKIADLEKQKKYMELQRDVRKLDKELNPEKVSKGKQLIDTLRDKVFMPAATEAGKEIVKKYMTEAGALAVTKALGKEKAKIDADVERAKRNTQAKMDKEAKKQAEKQAKKEAKQEAKEEARAEKQETKQETKQKTKTPSKSTSLDDYEKRVDSMLAEIDRKGWEQYYKEQGSISKKSSSNNHDKHVDELLAEIDENGWWVYEREYGGK